MSHAHQPSTPQPTRRTAVLGALGAGALGSAGLVGTLQAQASTVGLYDKIHAIDASTTGGLAVAVYDRRSQRVWQYNAGFRNEGASIMKVLVLAAACYRAQSARRGLTTNEKNLASSMIRYSDNNAAISLANSIGGQGTLQAMANRLGMTQTRITPHWGLSSTSAYDQLVLMNEIEYHGRFLSGANRTYILSLMGQVTAGQRWGVGSYGTTQVKNGWISLSGGWRVNSIGHVAGGGRNYTLAILQRGMSTMGAGTTIANRVASTMYNHLGTAL